MPTPPDWHPEDIKAAIRKTGLSVEALSQSLGYARASVRAALRKPWPKLEALIAQHLGVNAWDIWPSRYDADHTPLKAARPGRRRGSPSTPATTVTHRKSKGPA